MSRPLVTDPQPDNILSRSSRSWETGYDRGFGSGSKYVRNRLEYLVGFGSGLNIKIPLKSNFSFSFLLTKVIILQLKYINYMYIFSATLLNILSVYLSACS